VKRALLTATLAAGALVTAAGAASAAETEIVMPGKYFQPARLQIVAGDRVVFRNADIATHDVRVPAGPFDSGPLGRLGRWGQAFEVAGSYPFLCTLHPFMSGTLDVVNATIAASPEGVIAGEPLTLAGRAPAGAAEVGLLRVDADGTTHALPGAAAAADGAYALTTPAVEGARYRVTTPRGDSPEVAPRVSARVDAHLTVRHRGGTLRLQAHTAPAAHGLLATLELYDRWHYRWRARRTVRLDAHGTATFTLPAGVRTRARVALRRARGAVALVHSDVVRTRDGRPALDPDLIVPEHGAGHGAPDAGSGGHAGH
jgi:plastocyanin